MRTLLILGTAASFVLPASGCHPTVRPPAAAVNPDSLAGIVSITGTSFEQQLTLRSGDRSTRLSASAMDSAALSRVGGVEVLVVGKRNANGFRVDHFTARSVGGSPVVDGMLRSEGGRLVIETAGGRIPLGNPPSALHSMIGARVWISGALDRGPNSYGVIIPPA
jgi:hypothetical protein